MDEEKVTRVCEVVLEQRKLAYQGFITNEALARTHVRAFLDRMMDRFIVKVEATMYARKLDSQEVRIPFQQTQRESVTYQPKYLWSPLALGAVITFVAMVMGSWPMYLVACVVAAFAVIFYAMNPPLEVVAVATARGETVAKQELFHNFPDAKIPYPDELGGVFPYRYYTEDVRYDEP